MELTIGVVATFCSIVFGFLGYWRGSKSDYKEEGNVKGTLSADIQYIKRRTDEVLLEQKDTNRTMTEVKERLIIVEENAKTAHKRIDNMELDFKDCRKEYKNGR